MAEKQDETLKSNKTESFAILTGFSVILINFVFSSGVYYDPVGDIKTHIALLGMPTVGIIIGIIYKDKGIKGVFNIITIGNLLFLLYWLYKICYLKYGYRFDTSSGWTMG